MGVLAASEFPPNMDRAKLILDEVLEDGAQEPDGSVNMARHYAVNIGDHKLFKELLQEVERTQATSFPKRDCRTRLHVAGRSVTSVRSSSSSAI